MKRFLLLLCGLFGPGCAHTVELREPPDPAAVAALDRFPYEGWGAVLERFVDERGAVDYAGLRGDRGDLDRFAGLISAAGPRTRPDLFPTREDRLAYHLNAYNAFVLLGVVERPDLHTVHDELADFVYFTRYPFDGVEVSLLDLETELIRRRFGDPRIHFALNCASKSCPRLPREPFVGKRLDEQLERGTREFLADPRNVAVEGRTVVLSEIFDWYGEDFRPSPVEWIAARRPDLGLDSRSPVRFRPWDWTPNGR
jgi:hypothetical protein